jgi:hypothetical protein
MPPSSTPTGDRRPVGDWERFEDARLLAAIENARGGSAAAIVESITDAVGRFQGGTRRRTT